MEPVQIGAREIYDKLTGLDEKFDSFRADSDKRHALLEQRVASLEKTSDKAWRIKLATYGVVVGSAAAFLTELIGRIP